MVATKAGAAKSAWVAYLRETKAAYQAQKRDAENESLSSTEEAVMTAKRARGSNPRDSRGRFARFSAEVLEDGQHTPVSGATPVTRVS